ncbi:hypothetical protein Q428_12050 [Fervidicella metallireducens AeB]|uniref:Acyltransferase 3 domain-containing protein n=1 Tax=Fervidicella metallireducens AeB TaxID=1403537 RepID=A0A017RSQ9_9CLOT|nr:acyltransferase family protein [Fervidicella metallireducens]EYE87687.1 hypothetical protein Q428_12050 [Fervidicella metallireducens AeB]
MGKYESFKGFILKKFKRLIVPYLMIGTLFMLPIKMVFYLDNNRAPYFKRVLNEILLAKVPSHLWFILMLFNLFIIFYFVEKYLNKNNIVVNIFILFIVSILSIKLPNIYQISQSLQYLLFFYIGYSFYKYRDVIISIKNKWILFFIVHSVIFNIAYFIINNLKLSGTKLIGLKLFSLTYDKFIAFFGITFIFTLIEFLLNKQENTSHKLVNSKLLDKMSKIIILYI